jgi:DNA-binding NarL/FixJ family response regulator
MVSVSQQPPLVGIVSQQEILTKGLAAMLGEHPGRAVLSDPHAADVVLYDALSLHTADAAEADEFLRRTAPVVVAVIPDLRPDLRARALAQGAHGWISMSVRSDELIAAVESAAAGEELSSTWHVPGEVELTAREIEVLALVTRGLSNQEVAERLFLSINSVKSHLRSAYAKIGVRSRTQAVAWCLLRGFAPAHDQEVWSGVDGEPRG